MDTLNTGFTVNNANVTNYVGTDPLPATRHKASARMNPRRC